MTLQMTRVVPELLFYSEQYIKSSIVNKYKIPFPPTLSESYLLTNNSFIRLLFDETWPTYLTSYRYLYRQETDLSSIPETIRRRMMVYPSISRYYVCDSDSTAICNLNVFSLMSDDLMMLDLLLQFRLDSTSVSIVSIDYSTLSTHLSQLIYNYLNFKINNDISLFDNTILISSEIEVLESFYESYLIDLIFIYLSSLGS
jgi:hypothetical protein